MERIFYMEVGRSAVTGGGELWMEAEDSNIANNMHDAIMNSMSNSGPRERVHSSSAADASVSRHTGSRFHNSPLGES